MSKTSDVVYCIQESPLVVDCLAGVLQWVESVTVSSGLLETKNRRQRLKMVSQN